MVKTTSLAKVERVMVTQLLLKRDFLIAPAFEISVAHVTLNFCPLSLSLVHCIRPKLYLFGMTNAPDKLI